MSPSVRVPDVLDALSAIEEWRRGVAGRLEALERRVVALAFAAEDLGTALPVLLVRPHPLVEVDWEEGGE